MRQLHAGVRLLSAYGTLLCSIYVALLPHQVHCLLSTESASTVELVEAQQQPGGTISGHVRVLVTYQTRRFTPVTSVYDVCVDPNTPWTAAEAQVACRDLGYSGGSASVGAWSSFSWTVRGLRCAGTEPHLDQCKGAFSQKPRSCVAARVTCRVTMPGPVVQTGTIREEAVVGMAASAVPVVLGESTNVVSTAPKGP